MPPNSDLDPSFLSQQVYYYTSALTYAFLAASASILLLALMLYPTAVLRWLQRKRYQYEVTFSLYMLTPTEKFIFSTFAPHCLLRIMPLTLALSPQTRSSSSSPA